MFPHDEGTDGTHECLGQVQHDLQQEVECERPGDHLAVAHSLVGEGAGYWVIFILIQCAHAVLSRLLTSEATGLCVVVSSERHSQHWNNQADCTQDEVQELSRAKDKSDVMHFYFESLDPKIQQLVLKTCFFFFLILKVWLLL